MTKASPNEPDPGCVDLEVLREATLGDRDLMQHLAELYVNDADLQLRALDDALQNREADRIDRIGHALKGASLQVGANPMAAISDELERIGKSGELEKAADAIQRARAEFEKVRRALADLR